MRRAAVVLSVVIVGAILSWSLVLIATGEVSRPKRWVFPEGFRGWVVVRYRNTSCPPLRTDGIFYVLPIPASGQACTSNSLGTGWTYERFEYSQKNGRQVGIPAGDGHDSTVAVWNIASSGDSLEQYLFVGTRTELDQSWNVAPYR